MEDKVDGRGRPSLYSEQLADLICSQVASGKTMAEICAAPGMPCMSTVFNWLNDKTKKYFLESYSAAHKIHLMVEADELKFIADNVLALSAEVQKATLQIKTRMWRLSKLEPSKYGDFVEPGEPAAAPVRDLSKLSIEDRAHLLALERKMKDE